MFFFTTGKAAPPVHFDSKRQEARFTLRDKNNRFYVVTTSLEQYQTIQENQDAEILVIGSVFSFRCQDKDCRNYRVGFKPMLLLPLNGNIEEAERITAQLVKYAFNEVTFVT